MVFRSKDVDPDYEREADFLRKENQRVKDLAIYIDKIAQWGEDRNIDHDNGASALAQISKLLEEVAETVDHLNELYSMVPRATESIFLKAPTYKEMRKLLADDLGDMLVCIIQAARLLEIPMEEALEAAWNDIKYRKGSMVNGKFVKDPSISLGPYCTYPNCNCPFDWTGSCALELSVEDK